MSEDLFIDEFLGQDQFWIGRDGSAVPISSMTLLHRRKSAMFLLRRAQAFALASMASANDVPVARNVMSMLGASQTWMRTTPLFQAMVAGGADPDQFWAGEEAA